MGYTLEELMDFGLRLGADVPYCLMRGTALAEGIGEELTRLPACPPCYVVIAKPAISVSTRFVYENLRLNETTRHPDIYGLADAICRQDLYGMLHIWEMCLKVLRFRHIRLSERSRSALWKMEP